MITSSIETNDFNQVIPDTRFRVEAPYLNPFITRTPMDLTPSSNGLNIVSIPFEKREESVGVENLLKQIIVSCRHDVELHPSSARTHINLAIALINGGHVDDGILELNDAIKYDPANYVALNTLAHIKINRNELDEATAIYERLMKLYPDNAAPLINVAHIELRRENYIQAETLLSQSILIDTNSVAAKYLLAMVLLKLNKSHQSINLLRQASRDHERSSEIQQGLAIAYLVSADFQRAERAFKTALSLNENMVSAVHGLVFLKMQQNKQDEVVEILTNHLRNNPSDATSREILARSYVSAKKYDRALTQLFHLMKGKNLIPANRIEIARISNNIGFCFAQEGRLSEAEEWLKRSIDSEPNRNIAPYNNLARVYISVGRYQNALGVFARVSSKSDLDVQSHLLREVCFVKLGNHEAAIDELQGLLNDGNAPVQAFADLGWLLTDWHTEYDAALDILRKGMIQYPNNPLLINNLAYLHLMRGEPNFAREVLNNIPDDGNDHVQLIATRGLLNLWEGNFEEAERLYRKAERTASLAADQDLARAVKQKKHLEFAKAYIRNNDTESAQSHIKAGLSVSKSSEPYRFLQEIEELNQKLLNSSDGL